MSCVTDIGDSFGVPIPLPAGTGEVELRMDVDYERLVFGYRLPGEDWRTVPQVFDASVVSDEAGPPTLPSFTGAFVGVCCQDGAGTGRAADFDYFEYRAQSVSSATRRGFYARSRLNTSGDVPNTFLKAWEKWKGSREPHARGHLFDEHRAVAQPLGGEIHLQAEQVSVRRLVVETTKQPAQVGLVDATF